MLQLYMEYKQHLNNNRVFQNWQKHLVMSSFYFLAAKIVQGQDFQFGLASERLLENNLLMSFGWKYLFENICIAMLKFCD